MAGISLHSGKPFCWDFAPDFVFKAKRILFLVDTKNLGEQAEQEFMKYQPKDDNRHFMSCGGGP